MSQSPHVLLADDDPSFRRSVELYFEQQGFRCTSACDAGETLELLKVSSFDVLISDIHMAGNDDLAMVRALPEIAVGLPVILVTGYPSLDTAIEALQLPVFAYLVKPFRYTQLTDLVLQAAERTRLYRAIANERSRTESYACQLRSLEETLRNLPKADPAPTATAFVRVTVHKILASLLELESVTEKVVAKDATVTLPEGPAVESMKHLLHETVRVLERTRVAFKSRDLGALRKKVEEFLVTVGETP